MLMATRPKIMAQDGADLEVGEGLQAGHADLFQVRDAGDAAHDGQEHDRADEHLHRIHEGGADGFHGDAGGRREPADEDADDNGGQYPEVQLPVPTGFAGRRCRTGGSDVVHDSYLIVECRWRVLMKMGHDGAGGGGVLPPPIRASALSRAGSSAGRISG